ncbi:hypothetical protein M6D93_04585 [Jatrophihabitans telluris]|uniref:Uncharacterized protein n=1 Tax=Jatrophihabitans telluris TaxID=2038343 RepID=A0ABY4R0B6_9ACTN|nr:hypothetical protein [Jatrophihabitans telluris]UQX89284.1 hypothetical protein M6D93_04585 [Jatrophihabitans telluris]
MRRRRADRASGSATALGGNGLLATLDDRWENRVVPFVYHLCAEDFRGTHLLPLNTLRVVHPDVYDRERTKWTGRESVLQWQVPHLGVAWGDTVNLSALDPVQLVRARKRLGVPSSHLLQRRVARIPVDRIAHRAAVIYDSRSHWLNSRPGETVRSSPPEDEFTPFDADTYEELLDTPRLHPEYLSEQLSAGQPALGFVFVRHVLVAGPVDISGLPLERL